MPIENAAGAAGSLQPIRQTPASNQSESVNRRGDGSAASPFAKETNVSIRNSIIDLSAVLTRLSESQDASVDEMPQKLQEVIKNIMETSFAYSRTLGEGVGSTAESQRFSMEELKSLSRMLTQLGAMAEKGTFTGSLSDEVSAIVQGLKKFMTAEVGGSQLEPVLLNKLAFSLLVAEGEGRNPYEALPAQLMGLLLVLSGAGGAAQSNVNESASTMLKQLVNYFFPQADVEDGQEPQSMQNRNPAMQENQGRSMANRAAATGDEALLRQQGNDPTQNGARTAQSQPQSGGKGMPAGQQGQPAPQGQSASASQQTGQQGQPASQGQPTSASQQTGQQGQPASQGQSTVASQQTGQQGQPASQGQPTSASQQTGQQGQPASQGQSTSASPPTGQQGQPASQGQPTSASQPTGQQGQSVPQGQSAAAMQQMKPQGQSMRGAVAGGEPTQTAKTVTQFLPMENSAQLMQTLRQTAGFLLKHGNLTQTEQEQLQNFVQNKDASLSQKDVREMEQLLRVVRSNIPAAVWQNANRENLGELPRLWAFMQFADLLSTKDMKERQLKRAGRDLSDFVTSMRRSMEGESFMRTDRDGRVQRSVDFMVPLYLGEGEKQYPAYINVYNEYRPSAEDGTMHKETWFRLTVLTQNVGTAEMVFQIYDDRQVNMQLLFSEDFVRDEFQEYVPDIRVSFRDLSLELGELKIGTAGDRE